MGNKDNKIKSLISEFHYPRFGPGQMWETMCDEIIALGGEVRLNTAVEEIEIEDGEIVAIHAGGERIEPSNVISSLPLRATVGMAGDAAGQEVRQAAMGLRYRDFLTVALIIDGEDLFPDNWIYIHDDSVNVGRIQNFRSWSPWMVPDPTKASVGLEFFCFQGDELWEMDDDKLVELAKREIGQLGLGDPAKVEKGYVTRVPLAYPMYDAALRGARRRDPRLARRHRQPPAGRPQRPAPVQQLRPLDADGDARGGQHRQRTPDTTSGRSTRSPCTTRRTSRTSTRTAARPRRRPCASRWWRPRVRERNPRVKAVGRMSDGPTPRSGASLNASWRAYGLGLTARSWRRRGRIRFETAARACTARPFLFSGPGRCRSTV